MKRIIQIISVALAGILFSSCTQREMIVYHPSQQSGGQLNSIQAAYALDAAAQNNVFETFTFSESTYGVGCPVQYGLWASLTQDFEKEKRLGLANSANYRNGISVTNKAMNDQLTIWGCPADEPVTVYFRIKSDLMGEKNPIEGTTIISNVISSSITPYYVKKEGYDWMGVPGNYQGWAPDGYPRLYCYLEDGDTFTGVIDFQMTEGKYASDGFKIAQGAWDDDKTYGGPADGLAAEQEVIQLLQPGNDIKCYGEKRYYLFSFKKEAKTLTKVLSFDKVGIIGLNGDWDNDVDMTFNIYKDRFYADVDVPATTEFKFRLDGGWDTNWGGAKDNLSKNGDNIPIEAGQYRIYFYMGASPIYCELDPTMYGKEEPGAKEDPEPDPVYQGWGLIGDFNGWDGDVEMTEQGGVWTGYATIAKGQGFKIRKDAAWDDNRGATGDVEPFEVTLGEPFAVVSGGKNLTVPADGFYKIVYDSNAETMTVSDGTVWGVIGDFNSWNSDAFMTNADGVWTSPVITLEAGKGFKIRKNTAWDDNRGATGDVEPFEVTPGTAVSVVNNGKNFTVAATGDYIVVYNSNDETVTVNQALPSNTWSLIGVNDDWNNDIFMTELMPGVWVSPATAMSGSFKLRFNHDWTVNRGCDPLTLGGAARTAVQDGPNIGVSEGTYVIVYDSNSEIIFIQGWSLVGTLNGTNWDTDIPVIPMGVGMGEDVVWISYPFHVDETQEFKFRYNCGWDINRGGVFAEFCKPFAAVNNGDNIKIGQAGYYFAAYNSEEEEIGVGRADWGLIGDFNSWAGDVVMFEDSPGIYSTLNPVHLEAGKGFKIRKDRDWGENRGATGEVEPFEVTPGAAIAVVNNGKNFTVAATGDYMVAYDMNSETVMVVQL